MEVFYKYLATRKHQLLKDVYGPSKHAFNTGKCVERIEHIAQYQEVINAIHYLPGPEQNIVNGFFDDLYIEQINAAQKEEEERYDRKSF